MKTVEEVAEAIVFVYGSGVNLDHSKSIKFIADAITAYAEERVREADQLRSFATKAGIAQGRADALEEAAKVAWEEEPNTHRISEKIRALKEKP